MAAKADAFDIDQFLVFTSLDENTQTAIDNMRRKVPAIAGDYLILAQSYDDLIAQVGKLKEEWEYLQDNAHILVLQIVALCLVSFAAPFRLGKSVVELRTTLSDDTSAPKLAGQPPKSNAEESTGSEHRAESTPPAHTAPHS